MPRLCAFGCRQLSGVTVHHFPNPEKYPDRFKKWVNLCGGKLESESDYELYKKKIVCDKHFIDKDRNRFKRLNALAVPSLFLTGMLESSNNDTEADHNPEQASLLQLPQTGMLESSNNDTEASHNPEQASLLQLPQTGITASSSNVIAEASLLQLPRTVKGPTLQQVWCEHNYSAANNYRRHSINRAAKECSFNCMQISYMRGEVKQLRSEICRLKRNRKFQIRLNNGNKLLESVAFRRVVEKMSKPSQLLLNMQLQGNKKAKGRRFTLQEKVLSLSLYKKSPKCYTLLQKYFTLPSVKCMKRLLSKIIIGPGINPIVFDKIKKNVSEKTTSQKLCSLIFDEMSITPNLNYNYNKDIDTLTDIEGFATNNYKKFADHALVFMVKGITQNFKQPIAYYFTNSLNKYELKKLILTVIRHAQDAGLIIINTVCDQSNVNVSCINDLIQKSKAVHLRKGIEWRHDCFFVNGHKIIPLYDTPHLMKGLRNNLITKDLIYVTNNDKKTVKWEYYQKVYSADKSYGELRLLHKITEEHVIPEKINKMRVKTATQIFSHSVAVVTEHLTARGDLPEECRQLIDITLLLNNLFDSLNVSSLYITDGKVYKGPIRNNSPHHQLWAESKKILGTVKFIVKKFNDNNKILQREKIVSSIKNLIKTIEGVEAIWQIISKKYGLDALLTRNLNQDPVENFFGSIRSCGVRNIAPNTISFEGAFKALLLNNYNTNHSIKANCEKDENDYLQNLDFFIKEPYAETHFQSDLAPNSQSEIIFNEELLQEYNPIEDPGQSNYVCGWVITKCLKKICKSCQQCRQTLLLSEPPKTSYTRSKEYKGKNWLIYPSKDAENCFKEIQGVTLSFFKKNVVINKIRKTISDFCNLLIACPFNCSVHKEELKNYFINITIKLLLYSWCRNVNRILSGKISYCGEEEIKKKHLYIITNIKNTEIENSCNTTSLL